MAEGTCLHQSLRDAKTRRIYRNGYKGGEVPRPLT